MADNSNFFDTIPDDITGYLVQFLTVQELATFKQLCKQFNFIGSHAVFLQPLYNRLYAIDKTLSPTLTSENAPLEFKQAFEKIRDRQNEEIAFFIGVAGSSNATNFNDKTLQLLDTCKNAFNIETLELREKFIILLNKEIIKKSINAQPGHILDLSSCLTRFFITEEHVEYFKNLTTLICSNNLFTCISLNNHPKLELLDCRNNPSLKEIHLLGCSKSLEVKCDHDEEKPINIFCNNYDYYKVFKNLGLAAAYVFQNPMLGVLQFSLEAGRIVKELSNANNAPLPPKILMDDLESQDKKAKFLYIEEVQLFEQLKKETSDSKRSEVIQELGDRYNAQNCLKHGCIYEAGLIASNQASSVLEKTSNFFLSFMRPGKKETDATMTQEGSLKRKRKEDDSNEANIENTKRQKPNG